MTRRTFKAFLIGLAALASAFVAAAATIPSPVHPVTSPEVAARMTASGQEGLDFDASALRAMRQATGANNRIEDFPLAPGVRGTVILKRFEVLSPDATITVTGKDGDSFMAFPSIAHFSGKVEGDADSAVYVSAQDGRLVAWVRSSAGLSYVGPDESNVNYVVRSGDSPLSEPPATLQPWTCGAEDMPAPLTAVAEPSYPLILSPLAGLKQAAVRVETDQELLAKFPGPTTSDRITQMGAYVATLFGALNVIYERDLSLHLTVVEMRAWTTPDPYDGADTLAQLKQLGSEWHANRPMASYPRALVHYLSGRPVSGGIAWLSVLCSGDFPYDGAYGGAYGLTQVFGTDPLQMWDQDATAHEMGHNAGSPHTHCYTPAIDHCYNGEGGCYAGVKENPGVGNGTIMSYCHLLGWQYISLVFHPRCITETMIPEINGAACLTAAGTFEDVPPSNLFYDYVEVLAANGVTSGCSATPSLYCPSNSVNRAQMAVFLLKSKYGSDHVPPAATGTVFDDVPANAFAAAWIEELAGLGITGGCGGNNYCPNGSVTRRQMSAFLLKSLSGSDHVPPSIGSAFADVPDIDAFEPWIMELYGLAVTGGCATSPLRYCPDDAVTRAQMAAFLVKTFNLQ